MIGRHLLLKCLCHAKSDRSSPVIEVSMSCQESDRSSPVIEVSMSCQE